MATRMQQRRGTAAEWAAANPVLGNGEFGLETDTKILKIGDGVTAWNSLTSGYLRVGAKAADSELLDGLNSTAFLLVGAKAADSELLDGLNSTAFMLATATKTVRVPHTFAITGEVKVPSADLNYIPPFFVPVPAGQTVTVRGGRTRVNAGTSATINIGNSTATDIVSGHVVGTTASNFTSSKTIANDGMITMVVTAISGVPKNMTVTLYLDYQV